MISEKISKDLQKSSWIRLMFEEGEKLAQKYGRENVYDFSLGNPNDSPPKGVLESIVSVAAAQIKGKHGYMNNAGYGDTRESISLI